MLKQGSKAPDIELLDQNGKSFSLAKQGKGKILVYFYPKADTPGCTTQSCALRDALPDLSGLGAEVIGVSPDTTARQAKFDEKYGLGFTLLADTEHEMAEAYGVWAEKVNYGRKYMGIVRTTYLIGPDGKVQRRWDKVSVEQHADEVLAALK